MDLESEDTEIDVCADDSTECATCKTMAILEETLKADIGKIVIWGYKNRITTND